MVGKMDLSVASLLVASSSAVQSQREAASGEAGVAEANH
jgi:hypothetical protein